MYAATPTCALGPAGSDRQAITYASRAGLERCRNRHAADASPSHRRIDVLQIAWAPRSLIAGASAAAIGSWRTTTSPGRDLVGDQRVAVLPAPCVGRPPLRRRRRRRSAWRREASRQGGPSDRSAARATAAASVSARLPDRGSRPGIAPTRPRRASPSVRRRRTTPTGLPAARPLVGGPSRPSARFAGCPACGTARSRSSSRHVSSSVGSRPGLR